MNRISNAHILSHGEAIKNKLSAKPMLLISPRLKARRLFCEFSRAIAMEGDWVCHCREQVQTTCLIHKIIGWRALSSSGFFCLLFLAAAKKWVGRRDSFEKCHGWQYAKHMLVWRSYADTRRNLTIRQYKKIGNLRLRKPYIIRGI